MSDDTNKPQAAWATRMQKFVAPIAGATLLAIIGNGVWEFIAKPGISRLSSFVYSVITLGSEAFTNAIYRNAALNPLPMADNISLTFFSSIPFFFACGLVGMWIGKWLADSTVQKAEERARTMLSDRGAPVGPDSRIIRAQNETDARKLVSDSLTASSRRLRWASLLYCLVVAVFLYLGASTIRRAVIVWQVFHANLEICGPAMSDMEVKMLRSKFAQMKTKSDYDNINSQIQSVASKHGFELFVSGID